MSTTPAAAPVAPATPDSAVTAATAKLTSIAQAALAAVDGGSLSAATLVSLATQLAAAVNAVEGLSGADKKSLVVNVVVSALNSPPVTAKLQAATVAELTIFARDVLPAVIDVVVAAARGKYDLEKAVQEVEVGCCGFLTSLSAKA